MKSKTASPNTPKRGVKYPNVEAGLKYAKDVIADHILNCKWVRLAAQRHLEDLEKAKSPDYPFRFDMAKAERACSFIQELPHVKGKWARPRVGESNLLVLQPWQLFIVICIFGWVERSSGFRRFTEVYIEVPRKNGKSILAAAIGLYMLLADYEAGAEVYSCATKLAQAMEVFKPARMMVLKSPDLMEYYGLEKPAVHGIFREEDASKFIPLCGNPGDGASPSCAINDEYHEAETSIVHDTMQTGMGAREQPLLLNITTAGSMIDGPCHQLRHDVEQMLENLIENDSLFGVIYTLDEGDDWKTPEALKKANPNYGISVMQSYLEKQQRQAMQYAHKQNAILTKHFDLWQNTATSWMNMAAWKACADPSLKIEDFRGVECFEGDDLAAKIDLASRAQIFRRVIGGLTHYYLFSHHYVPRDRVIDGDHPHYEKWVADGWLTAHDGPEIQLSEIQREIEAEIGVINRVCIAFDPWGALQMQQDLERRLGPEIVITIPQKVEFLSNAMKEVEAAVIAGRFHHTGDPVMTWAISNVQVRPDHNENIFPRKDKKTSRLKIDPASALFNGMSRAYMPAAPKKFTPVIV